MKDAYQVKTMFARRTFGFQQVFRPQFVAFMLHADKGIFERQCLRHQFFIALNMPKHDAAALVGIGLFGMQHHGLPGAYFDIDHIFQSKGVGLSC